jgi:hypothetical protein
MDNRHLVRGNHVKDLQKLEEIDVKLKKRSRWMNDVSTERAGRPARARKSYKTPTSGRHHILSSLRSSARIPLSALLPPAPPHKQTSLAWRYLVA